MGLAMMPPSANGTGMPRWITPPLAKATPENAPASAPPNASVSGLKAALQGDLGELEAERAQHVAEAFALEGEIDEGGRERAAEAGAEPGAFGELGLQRRWCRRR